MAVMTKKDLDNPRSQKMALIESLTVKQMGASLLERRIFAQKWLQLAHIA